MKENSLVLLCSYQNTILSIFEPSLLTHVNMGIIRLLELIHNANILLIITNLSYPFPNSVVLSTIQKVLP